MLEYWMSNNDSSVNSSEFQIEEVLEDPGSAILFAGYPSWLLYFAAGCCVLFMLIGIPGNLITVAALFRTKKLRNATAVFIMNLSVSDLMFCCFNLPLATSTFWHGSWMHGPLLCRLFPLLRYGLVAVSLFTVLAITINRYVMIGHPRLYPKLYKPKYLVLMVLATWISGFGALVATWFEQWGRFGLDPAIGSCSILPDVNGRSPKEFLFILAFLTPCIAIIVCYARIFYIVRKTALKSRRRDKVTSDLVKANSLEVKYTKNFEDSAIGSSCGATLTTTENGGSPTKYHEKNFNYNLSSSLKIIENRADEKINSRYENNSSLVESQTVSSVENSKSDENLKEQMNFISKESLNEEENNRESSKNDRNERFLTKIVNDSIGNLATVGNADTDNIIKIPDLQIQGEKIKFDDNSRVTSSEDEDEEIDPRSNFERSVEFLPFIDTYAEQILDSEVDSAFTGNSENVASQSIPNLRFFEADSNSENSDNDHPITEEYPKYRKDFCLQVPRRFPRSLEIKSSDRSISSRVDQTDSIKSKKITNNQQISRTLESLENDNNGAEVMKKILHDFKCENSVGLLSPAQLVRCNSEISDEFASSRSDSPSERRGSVRKTSGIFRRESRFRSVRNRAFESGKMTAKDKKLLKMILVIFSSFLICYLPITITKTFKDIIDWRGLNIAGYILIYLTTCINPVIYVVMSSEYRCAYKNVLLCRSDSMTSGPNCKPTVGNADTNYQERKRRNRKRKNENIN